MRDRLLAAGLQLLPYRQALGELTIGGAVTVIALSLEIRPTSEFERWFWDLNQEANVGATLASTQLALVSIAAFATAWVARGWQARHRLYMAALGLVFLFFAWDEFFLVHEQIANWEILYAVLGAVVVAATALVAASSPRRSRIWYICLLIGLAISATGAIVLEHFRIPAICDRLGFLPEAGRCQLYIVEESLEFLGIWLTLIAVLGLFSSARPRPRPLVLSLLFFLPLLWILVLSPSVLVTFLDFRFLHQRAAIKYEPGAELQAYRVDREEGTFALQFFASTVNWHDYSDLGYSLHLVDQATGESFAGADESASRQERWRMHSRSYYFYMFKQRISVQLSPPFPTNRALWLVLTLWRKEGNAFVHQKIISSDYPLLDETQVILGEFVMQAQSVASSSIPIANFENGFTLDAANVPESAQAGETLAIPFAWRTDKDGREDFVQFLHLGHEASGAWWVHDQQPLGPRLPTRVWYSGLGDSNTWQVPLAADLAAGRYTVFTGLYRAGDQVRLPATDAEGTPFVDARVPLGVLTIEGA